MTGVLFVHNNFPGQFGFIAEALQRSGEKVAAIAKAGAQGVANVPMARWTPSRGSTPGLFPPATRAEADLLRATEALKAGQALKAAGFEPDLVIGHPGWGETLFLKELWPNARMILYAEFYYHARGMDVGFDPEFEMPDTAEACRILAKNATLNWAYSEADHLVSPTRFQGSTLPKSHHGHLSVIHEGVDLQRIRPQPDAQVDLGEGRVFDRSRPVITFVNRIMEPLRGCHIFFRALPALLKAVPDVQVVIAGSAEGRGYGAAPSAGGTWKEHFWKEVEGDVDAARVHFVGRVPNDVLNRLMSIAAAHVYWTYPFALSWSLMEAMACEALVIGSDTLPVRDAIRHGENGILVDFFRPDLLSEALIDAVKNPHTYADMRKAARKTVMEQFDRNSVCLPAWMDLIRNVRTERM